jgi:23S rRNA (pseudouridine1915-N3)-methyltransferase
MRKIRIYSPGKEKGAFFQEACAEYEKRLTAQAEIIWILPKDNTELLKLLEEETDYICLSPRGNPLTSEQFAKKIEPKSRLAFVIGQAEGLPEKLEKHKDNISLSNLTFTHQMCRLILIEQIYRAHEIFKGTSYHK